MLRVSLKLAEKLNEYENNKTREREKGKNGEQREKKRGLPSDYSVDSSRKGKPALVSAAPSSYNI